MSVKVSRILHAGYIFEADNHRIAFDPIFENPFSTNCQAFPNVSFDKKAIQEQKFDAVIISHFHDDHLSLVSLDLISKQTPIYLFCVHEEFFYMIKQLGFKNVYSVQLGQSFKVGSFTIKAFKAVDEEVDSIFQIQTKDFNILNVVDAWIHEDSLETLLNQAWDLILWPFQLMQEVEVLSPQFSEKATGNLPAEWIEQLQQLNPKTIVPSSCQFIQEDWSWLRTAYFPISYKKFTDTIQSALPSCKVQRLNPGDSYLLTKNSFTATERLIWIKPVGDQNVDYNYNPILQTVKEIAKHFPELTDKEKRLITNYCNNDLKQIFKEIGPASDIYFNKTRTWKLTVHHNNEKQIFYFKLEADNLTSTTETLAEWTAEIPAYKLLTAITKGEQLTSLYLQINFENFTNDQKEKLKQADPLLRILSSRSITSFHKHQLSLLKK